MCWRYVLLADVSVVPTLSADTPCHFWLTLANTVSCQKNNRHCRPTTTGRVERLKDQTANNMQVLPILSIASQTLLSPYIPVSCHHRRWWPKTLNRIIMRILVIKTRTQLDVAETAALFNTCHFLLVNNTSYLAPFPSYHTVLVKFLLWVGYLSSMHCSSVVSENVIMSYTAKTVIL